MKHNDLDRLGDALLKMKEQWEIAADAFRQLALNLSEIKESLRELELALHSSDICALDAESDDKDPRKANLRLFNT